MKQTQLVRTIRIVSPLFFSLSLFFMGVFDPTPVHAAPSVTMTANPQNVIKGGASVLSWTVSGAVSCTASDSTGWSDPNFQTTSGSMTLSNIQTSITYYLKCFDAAGNEDHMGAPIIVGPSLTLTASPTTISAGDPVTITWDSSGNLCPFGTAAVDLGLKGGSGSLVVNPAVSTTYFMTCYNVVNGVWGGGSPTRSVAITVNPASPVCNNGIKEGSEACDDGAANNGACPKACSSNCTLNSCSTDPTNPTITSFVANTMAAQFPVWVDFSWTTQNATSCKFNGGSGGFGPNGSWQEFVMATTTYSLECFNAVGLSSGKKSVNITIGGGGGGCVPDNSCAVTTCTNTSCANNCGDSVQGTCSTVACCGGGVPPTVSLLVSTGAVGSVGAASLALPAGGGDIVLAFSGNNAASCRFTNTGPAILGWVDSFFTPLGSQNKYVPLTVTSTTTFSAECFSNTDATKKSVTVTVGGSCVPNGACTAANTCNTTTCTTNCGVVITGTKVCGGGGGGGNGGGGGGNGGGVATGGLIPCGKSFGSAAEQAPCTVCHLIVGGNNLIKWGLGIMSVIAITVMFAMAVLYVVSAGNPSMMQTAKGGIFAVLIGFGVMLSAWLIVNTVLTILVNNADNTKPLGGLVQQGVFKFSCDTSSNVGK